MAELVVVSSIIIITLTSLYVSYNKIITSYKQVINYYDVGFVYKLGYYYKTLHKNNLLDGVISTTNENDYTNLKNKLNIETNEAIYLVKDINSLNKVSNTNINQTFKEYIKYVQDSVEIEDNYFLIGETCQNNKKNCKYGYLEVSYEEVEQ